MSVALASLVTALGALSFVSLLGFCGVRGEVMFWCFVGVALVLCVPWMGVYGPIVEQIWSVEYTADSAEDCTLSPFDGADAEDCNAERGALHLVGWIVSGIIAYIIAAQGGYSLNRVRATLATD